MTYHVKLLPSRASSFLDTLDKSVAERITKKLRVVENNPFRYLERYTGKGRYKLRIGKYRALIDVDSKNRELLVMALDKRSRIYKRRKE